MVRSCCISCRRVFSIASPTSFLKVICKQVVEGEIIFLIAWPADSDLQEMASDPNVENGVCDEPAWSLALDTVSKLRSRCFKCFIEARTDRPEVTSFISLSTESIPADSVATIWMQLSRGSMYRRIVNQY